MVIFVRLNPPFQELTATHSKNMW